MPLLKISLLTTKMFVKRRSCHPLIILSAGLRPVRTGGEASGDTPHPGRGETPAPRVMSGCQICKSYFLRLRPRYGQCACSKQAKRGFDRAEADLVAVLDQFGPHRSQYCIAQARFVAAIEVFDKKGIALHSNARVPARDFGRWIERREIDLWFNTALRICPPDE